MSRPARLVVDPIACDGRGLCAELLPALITLDDWGFPVIADGDIPAPLRADATTVVRLCPRLALRLEQAAPGSRDRGQVPPRPSRRLPLRPRSGVRRTGS